ncbi:MAG: recombinase family protein [Candidatus Coproplasma sp.]
MKPKQNKNYIAGIYARLSRDDGQDAESASIENQRLILTKYVEEQGWTLHEVYVDDGISGTTFERPGVQKLLEDAKNGIINTIIVKDLSRFGRNYIQVGQYLDYVFPAFGIRFIALQDNVDTANRDNSAMEMMPIMNVFNEWHAANTSKKVKSVIRAQAKDGKYHSPKAPFGYVIVDKDKRLPVVDEPAASIVKRIFDMRLKGYSTRRIADILNLEGIPSPQRYMEEKFGKKGDSRGLLYWSYVSVKAILENPLYKGDLVQQRTTTVSYKNHKRIYRDESEFLVIPNTHEAIIEREVWDRVQALRNSVSRGRERKKNGFIHPLSGLLFCANCGGKMQMRRASYKGKNYWSFDCGDHCRLGKAYCFSHHIAANILEELILTDIQSKADTVIADEAAVRRKFLEENARLSQERIRAVQQELKKKNKRLAELDGLIENVYEDKVKGKMPEDICIKLINRYTDEQKTLTEEIQTLNESLAESNQLNSDVDEFIAKIKRYLHITELTREICMELIDRIIVGAAPKDKTQPRSIQIVYKVNLI